MTECGDSKLTLRGGEVMCIRPYGHDGPHESAEYAWLPEMNWAAHCGS